MAPLVPLSEFDFSVHVTTHTVTVKAGQTVPIPIAVQAVKGDPRPIRLTASDWRSAGLSADIAPSPVPSGGSATLYVTVPAGAAPGSYLFTVRGEAEGTFKTSNDTVTVVVAPDEEGKDGQDGGREGMSGDGQAETPVPAPPARAMRASLFRSAKKAPARPPSGGQRAILAVLMVVMGLALGFAIVNMLGLTYEGTGGTGTTSGTYTGTSTFCIKSVLGNAPDCGTSNCSIQIDSSGNVLGPGLFGKITGSSFTGEARDGNGGTFAMTGTFSNGTLSARHESSSVTWTITVSR